MKGGCKRQVSFCAALVIISNQCKMCKKQLGHCFESKPQTEAERHGVEPEGRRKSGYVGLPERAEDLGVHDAWRCTRRRVSLEG